MNNIIWVKMNYQRKLGSNLPSCWWLFIRVTLHHITIHLTKGGEVVTIQHITIYHITIHHTTIHHITIHHIIIHHTTIHDITIHHITIHHTTIHHTTIHLTKGGDGGKRWVIAKDDDGGKWWPREVFQREVVTKGSGDEGRGT